MEHVITFQCSVVYGVTVVPHVGIVERAVRKLFGLYRREYEEGTYSTRALAEFHAAKLRAQEWVKDAFVVGHMVDFYERQNRVPEPVDGAHSR